ncbi:MAG: hypothetical protein P9L97_09980 [Candidatus Tenebribacter davisii]|nr:hypothetical protein [Candidatus Tenebribacter davisii]
MKKIKYIEIKDFKALYGVHEIDFTAKCKNLMIYGENGSGKSSFCKAIKTFLESSVNDVNFADYENVFLKRAERGNGYIKLQFRDLVTKKNENILQLNSADKRNAIQYLSEANKVKGFLDYRSLFATHFFKGDRVNLFELLLEDLLNEAINPITTNKIGEEWNQLKENIKKRKNSTIYNAIPDLLKNFNDGLVNLLKEIEDEANSLIDYFNYDVKLHINFPSITLNDDKTFGRKFVFMKIDFFDRTNLPKYHQFLNEARLTAIAISIYLGSLLRCPQPPDFKILILDDVFIGLDTSNRIPFIELLKDKFNDYQIIMATYDKQWYEFFNLEADKLKWAFAEFYIKEEHQNGYEIPITKSGQNIDYISISEDYLNKGDLKASAVYIRSEFERLLMRYCHKNKLRVKYCCNPSKISSEDFWISVRNLEITNATNQNKHRLIPKALKEKIERKRTLVMNPFSHYDITRLQFRAELKATIDAVKELRNYL